MAAGEEPQHIPTRRIVRAYRLVTAQIPLGYTAGESDAAATWHVRIAVLLFGLGILNSALALFRTAPGQTPAG